MQIQGLGAPIHNTVPADNKALTPALVQLRLRRERCTRKILQRNHGLVGGWGTLLYSGGAGGTRIIQVQNL